MRLLIYKENSTNFYFSIYLFGWETLVIKRNKEEAGSEWIESVEARKMLGVSPKTWQTYRDRRVIPFAQIGRKILVKKADLDAFMREHYISTEK